MLKTSFILREKKQLTHDVYELSYHCSEVTKEPITPGQYVMFLIAPGLSRAYSVAHASGEYFSLIIKRVAEGRGSPIICDAPVGTTFSGMLPLGHFTLKANETSKCFIGTGTGFAPLYFQLLGVGSLKNKPKKIAFIFGVRNFSDSFYEKEIETIAREYHSFEYIQYFSRELDMSGRSPHHESRVGYVTDWITHESIKSYEEYYICGSPAMVKSAREKLASLGVEKEQIFWEQF